MPYIPQDARDRLASPIEFPRTVGELAYLYTLEALEALGGWGPLHAELNKHTAHYIERVGHSFTTYAAVLGSLTAAKMEFERRMGSVRWQVSALAKYIDDFYITVVAPYEDRKCNENGEVYV